MAFDEGIEHRMRNLSMLVEGRAKKARASTCSHADPEARLEDSEAPLGRDIPDVAANQVARQERAAVTGGPVTGTTHGPPRFRHLGEEA